MWIVLNSAFVSCVQDRTDPTHLVVRARRKGDIERALGVVGKASPPHSDYAWRAHVPRGLLAEALARHVNAIDYDNFKSSVKNRLYHDVLLRVWSDLYELQVPIRRKFARAKPLLEDWFGAGE